MTAEILAGDVLEKLRELPSESVHLVVTSPPYWGLRCYGVEGQLGLEPTPEEHVERMVAVFREVRRVLRRDGVLALNYGDCYAGAGYSDWSRWKGGQTFKEERRPPRTGLKPKDLVGMPFRLALALQADGWWWRSCMPWVKRSAMPESTTDRPSTALEYVMLFAKSERYFWDADAVRRPQAEPWRSDGRPERMGSKDVLAGVNKGFGLDGVKPREYNPNGRNLRNSDFYFDSLDLRIEQARAELAHLTHLRERGGLLLSEEGEPLALDVNTEATKEEHFAAFPRKLVQPLIQAGTSERGCCAECGAPWVRVTEKTVENKVTWGVKQNGSRNDSGMACNADRRVTTLGWRKSCRCETDATLPATVLDPFAGTGTTLFVALELGRRAVGIELSPKYAGICKRRLRRAQLPLDLAAD